MQSSRLVAQNSPLRKPPENPNCVFCLRSVDNESLYGKKLFYSAGYVHYYCMLFASGAVQRGTEKQGVCGFMPCDLNKELRRGKPLVCIFCERKGACIGCCVKTCRNQWHFPCGLENGALNQFFGNFNSYCEEHRPRQFLELSGPLDRVCTICMSEVQGEVNSNNALRAPCCSKNVMYHRDCIKRYADSSGLHHFKCPLCNDVKKFQAEMQRLGIYIPDQDASWEREPNAFHELLERYSKCDEAKCLCPNGREFNNKRSKKWLIVLCDICGSSGCHIGCAGLKTANDEWICGECVTLCPTVPKKKKKVEMNYDEWRDQASGIERIASSDEEDQNRRRKVVDWRTPCHVKVDLCTTGVCEGIPKNVIRILAKRIHRYNMGRTIHTNKIPDQQAIDSLGMGDSLAKDQAVSEYHDFVMKNASSENALQVKKENVDNSGFEDPIKSNTLVYHVGNGENVPGTSSGISTNIDQPDSSMCHDSNLEFNEPSLPVRSWASIAYSDQYPLYITKEEKLHNKLEIRKKLIQYAFDEKDLDYLEEPVAGTSTTETSTIVKSRMPKSYCEEFSLKRQSSVLGDLQNTNYAEVFNPKPPPPQLTSQPKQIYPSGYGFGEGDENKMSIDTTASDLPVSKSDIFPNNYSINVKNLNIDFSRKPQMPLHDFIDVEALDSPDQNYTDKLTQNEKNYVLQNISYRPPNSTLTRPNEDEVVYISDDDELVLDLTTTPDDEPDAAKSVPLVCDLTDDGAVELSVNENASGSVNIGSISSDTKAVTAQQQVSEGVNPSVPISVMGNSSVNIVQVFRGGQFNVVNRGQFVRLPGPVASNVASYYSQSDGSTTQISSGLPIEQQFSNLAGQRPPLEQNVRAPVQPMASQQMGQFNSGELIRHAVNQVFNNTSSGESTQSFSVNNTQPSTINSTGQPMYSPMVNTPVPASLGIQAAVSMSAPPVYSHTGINQIPSMQPVQQPVNNVNPVSQQSTYNITQPFPNIPVGTHQALSSAASLPFPVNVGQSKDTRKVMRVNPMPQIPTSTTISPNEPPRCTFSSSYNNPPVFPVAQSHNLTSTSTSQQAQAVKYPQPIPEQQPYVPTNVDVMKPYLPMESIPTSMQQPVQTNVDVPRSTAAVPANGTNNDAEQAPTNSVIILD